MRRWTSALSIFRTASLVTKHMMSCAPLLKACNYQVDVVDKSSCGLATVPDDILRYGRSLDELLLDANQIRDIPKVRLPLSLLKG